MKTKLLFLALLVSSLSYAQYTAIPDANFENALSTYDDIANDGQVPTANINTITYLDVSYKNIADLTGIEDFTALTYLYCSGNHLSSLDVSHNLNLTNINFSYNQISNINFSQNTNLNLLNCGNNQISHIDISQNINLTDFRCRGNQITDLDVSQNINLTKLYCSNNQLNSFNVKNGHNSNIRYFNATNNPKLTCIEVDDVAYCTANWSVDPQTNFSTNCRYDETYVPDDNFENYLETHDAGGSIVSLGDPNSMGNGIANDDYVTTANINAVTNLNINSQNISDLTGVEYFTALSILDCSNNEITELNISQNINITEFNCSNNYLTRLNVRNGHNTNITYFNAINNPDLTCVEVDDVAYSTANWTNIDSPSSYSTNCHFDETYVPDDNFEYFLETTDANNYVVSVGDPNSRGNGILNDNYVTTAKICILTRLDIWGQNFADLTGIEDFTALRELNCGDEQLTSLDISQNTNLTNLTCSHNQLSNLDVSLNTNLTWLDCSQNQLNNLDVSQNTNLTNLLCDDNPLNNLDVSQNLNLEELSCYETQLTSLDVSHNTNLVFLYCGDNPLGNLDVSQNTNLAHLYCTNNQLSSLDVSQNTNLQWFSCIDNQLTSLDVSQNTILNRLFCSNNQLTSLNVKNGNNTNFNDFNATNNPNLSCIEVDNVAWSNANWRWYIDSQTSFSTDCAAGVDESTLDKSITIYPNPVNHILNLSAQNPIENVKIYNVTGQEVINIQANSTEAQVDMGKLQNGIYFVKVQINGQVTASKVVKE